MQKFWQVLATITAITIQPVAAQEQPSPGDASQSAQSDNDAIIVIGEAERKDTESKARTQAKKITPRGATLNEPLPRFQRPVCAGVVGLAPESAQLIIDRIYFNAENIGLEVDRQAGCIANILVLIVADPDREIDELIKAQHLLLNGLTYWDRKRLRRQTGPVRIWQFASTRTSAGQTRDGRTPIFDTTSFSRLKSAIRRDLEYSVIMIDSKYVMQIDGVTLADYATMRSLARTRTPDITQTEYSTILTLFDDPDTAPQRLTNFDLAYLRSIYSGAADRPGNMSFNRIGQIIRSGDAAGKEAP